MPSLIALAMPGGDAFVAALLSAWEAGNAVAPLDPRLPPGAAASVLASLAPSALIDADGERHRLEAGMPVEEGDALVVATSGTTGRPRGVVLTHDAVAASARATSSRLGVDPASDRWLACLPLAHVGGLSVVTRALVTGTPLVVHPRCDPAAVCAAAGGTEPVTLVSLVARSLVGAAAGATPGRRVDASPGRRVDASLFRTVVLGGSAPPSDLPGNVVTTYGMTETGSGVVYDGIPLEGVEVELGPGGAIRLRGPMLCRGYRDGSAACDSRGWLTTGDVGTWRDGRLVVRGRLSDLIISGGENVWPVTVEEVIGTHPGVAEVAVVGRADEEWGERVVAVVVPGAGFTPGLEELREMVKAAVGAWAAPRELVLVDSLPRTSIGKLRRREVA